VRAGMKHETLQFNMKQGLCIR